MRKLLSALCCLLLVTGLVVASDVTLVKYDKTTKELTVTAEDGQKTYKVNEKTKFICVDKKTGETKAMPYDKALLGLLNPHSEGHLKFAITVKDGQVVEAKFPGRKKK